MKRMDDYYTLVYLARQKSYTLMPSVLLKFIFLTLEYLEPIDKW